MNDIVDDFVNPFVKYPWDYGLCSLAGKVLRQLHHKREPNLHWPSMEERFAKYYINEKPAGLPFSEWVKYWKNTIKGN